MIGSAVKGPDRDSKYEGREILLEFERTEVVSREVLQICREMSQLESAKSKYTSEKDHEVDKQGGCLMGLCIYASIFDNILANVRFDL